MKVSTISANTYTERFKLKALKAPKRGQENPIIENGITKKAIEIMKAKHQNIVVTGSLHFVSTVRKYVISA